MDTTTSTYVCTACTFEHPTTRAARIHSLNPGHVVTWGTVPKEPSPCVPTSSAAASAQATASSSASASASS